MTMFIQDELPIKTPPPQHLIEGGHVAQLRLLRSPQVSNESYYSLVREYETPENALSALPKIAQKSGNKNYRICPEGIIRNELHVARNIGASLIETLKLTEGCPMKADETAPPLLWCLGNAKLIDQPLISLIGSKNPSSLAIRMTKKITQGLLGTKLRILSDLKEGIAQVSATEAMEHGVVVVSANGIDIASKHKYLTSNRSLLQKGLLVTEVPVGQRASDAHFKARDHIMSGLARAIIVVECSAKSKSFKFAQNALDRGTHVFVVPGHPVDARASGCNNLIRDGATLIRSSHDILDALGYEHVPDSAQVSVSGHQPQPSKKNKYTSKQLHQKIMDLVSNEPMVEDHLIDALNGTPQDVSIAIVELELADKVIREPGALICKT